MASCAAGCGFFATPGSIYCSKHFNELATPEEKAERQRKLDEEKNEVENAQAAFESALTGPIESAREALITVKNRTGFREGWIRDEIMKAAKTKGNVDAVQKIINLSQYEEIKDGGKIPLLSLLHQFVLGVVDPENAGFLMALNHPLVTPETLDFKIMEDAIYRHRSIHMVEKLIRKGKVTKQLVDAARYSCKKPANVPTPEKLAIIKLVEEVFKEQQAALKRGAEDVTVDEGALKRARIALEAVPETCQFLRKVSFDGATHGPHSFDMWTCGTYPHNCHHIHAPTITSSSSTVATEEPTTSNSATTSTTTIDHSQHSVTQWQPQHILCQEVAISALTWIPQHEKKKDESHHFVWNCCFFTKEQLHACGVSADTVGVTEIFASLIQLPLKKTHSKEIHSFQLVTKTFKNTAKVFFHKRWYSGFNGNEVDEEIFTHLQATTNAFKAASKPNTAIQFTIHSPEAELYSMNIFLVAEAKQIKGGLVVFIYSDSEQEHCYYGSK